MSALPPSQKEILESSGRTSVPTFLSALTFNGLVALGFFTAFLLLRKRLPYVYTPRTFLPPQNERTRPLNGLALLRSCLDPSKDDIIAHAGHDAYALLLYMRTLLYFFGSLVGLAIITLFPLHATGGQGLIGLNSLTLANVAPSEEKRLWAHLIVSWVYIVTCLVTIHRLLSHAIHLRHNFLLCPKQQASIAGYTLLIRDIPRKMRDPDILRLLFDRVQPGCVHAVVVVKKSRRMKHYAARMKRARGDIERIVCDWARREMKAVNERRGSVTPEEEHDPLDHNTSAETITAQNNQIGTENPHHHPVEEMSQVSNASPSSDAQSSLFQKEIHRKLPALEQPKIKATALFEECSSSDAPLAPVSVIVDIPAECGQSSDTIPDIIVSAVAETKNSPHETSHTPSKQGSLDSISNLPSNLSKLKTSTPSLRPTHRTIPILGAKYDALTSALEILHRNHKTHSSRLQSPSRTQPAAFIVFKDMFSPHVAALVNIHSMPGVMADKYAGVDPRDVIWDNLNVPFLQRRGRALMATCVILSITLAWASITTFLSSIASLDKLIYYAPFLDFFNDFSPAVRGVIQGVVPTVAVTLVFQLIPIVMHHLLTFAGVPTKTEIERKVMVYYFIFLVFNILLVITISGSLFTAVFNMIQYPSRILGILATSIPTVSNFFVNYVMLLSLGGPAGELLQLGTLIIKPACLKFFGKTPRSIRDWSRLSDFMPGPVMAQHTFVATIGMTYCTIAPLVLVFVVIYYGLYYLAYGYQMQYVYSHMSQTGGWYLHTAAKQLFVGVYLHQLVLLGLFLLKRAFAQAAMMAIGIVVTLLAHRHAELYAPLMRAVPAKAIVRMEQDQAKASHISPNANTEVSEAQPEGTESGIVNSWRTYAQRRKSFFSDRILELKAHYSGQDVADAAGNAIPSVLPVTAVTGTGSRLVGQTGGSLGADASHRQSQNEESEVDSDSDSDSESGGSKISLFSINDPQRQSFPHPTYRGPPNFTEKLSPPHFRPKPLRVWLPDDCKGFVKSLTGEIEHVLGEGAVSMDLCTMNEQGELHVRTDGMMELKL
ncbi:hypothetical protein DFS34DRAFT_647388 [Phlyctochytrium arcticum]|nr:hypothetical protein DFS34DRAFT_647388 [Phlyctochytrium arcticum]